MAADRRRSASAGSPDRRVGDRVRALADAVASSERCGASGRRPDLAPGPDHPSPSRPAAPAPRPAVRGHLHRGAGPPRISVDRWARARDRRPVRDEPTARTVPATSRIDTPDQQPARASAWLTWLAVDADQDPHSSGAHGRPDRRAPAAAGQPNRRRPADVVCASTAARWNYRTFASGYTFPTSITTRRTRWRSGSGHSGFGSKA